jgi:nicotinamidase-related amidase
MRLNRQDTLILVIDMQERLAAAIPADALARAVKSARALVLTAREMGIPVLATEQYPSGLGPTLAALREVLPTPPMPKIHFSCLADPAFKAALEKIGRRQIVVAGLEAHVCVYLSSYDLAGVGTDVFVCADAVASRTEEHRRVGLELCREGGAIVTTAETVIFDLLHQAGTPEFSRVLPFVK